MLGDLSDENYLCQANESLTSCSSLKEENSKIHLTARRDKSESGIKSFTTIHFLGGFLFIFATHINLQALLSTLVDKEDVKIAKIRFGPKQLTFSYRQSVRRKTI